MFTGDRLTQTLLKAVFAVKRIYSNILQYIIKYPSFSHVLANYSQNKGARPTACQEFIPERVNSHIHMCSMREDYRSLIFALSRISREHAMLSENNESFLSISNGSKKKTMFLFSRKRPVISSILI